MNIKATTVLILGIAAISGCAVKDDRANISGIGFAYHSDVTRNDDGTYFASVEAAPLAGRIGGAQSQVTEDAVKKCKSLGKAMNPIKEETSSHLLINGVAKLTFSCI